VNGKGLALALLVLGILPADDAAHDLALAAATKHEAAILADGLNGGADFHRKEKR
jgi:hypothetical protein